MIRPYPDMFEQRNAPRGYMSSSSRNGLHSTRSGAYPPEYPFHPASYARGNDVSMRDNYRGGGGSMSGAAYHDPYMRGPYGGLPPPPPPHPSYFRGPGSRYDYEQYPPLPPPRNR